MDVRVDDGVNRLGGERVVINDAASGTDQQHDEYERRGRFEALTEYH